MRDSETEIALAGRSRRSFRWMPAPVLWHNVRGEPVPELTSQGMLRGRNLYARKLRESGSNPAGEPSEGAPVSLGPRRAARELLRWQTPFGYLVVARGAGWLLTWHAPWCRRCDCPGAGWRFERDLGYWSGLGFELSYARPHTR